MNIVAGLKLFVVTLVLVVAEVMLVAWGTFRQRQIHTTYNRSIEDFDLLLANLRQQALVSDILNLLLLIVAIVLLFLSARVIHLPRNDRKRLLTSLAYASLIFFVTQFVVQLIVFLLSETMISTLETGNYMLYIFFDYRDDFFQHAPFMIVDSLSTTILFSSILLAGIGLKWFTSYENAELYPTP